MKTILKTILFFILFSTNLEAQKIDATLLEINFAGDSNPKNITKGTTKIYFSADDGVYGRELWVSNTITNTTNLAKDIYVGSASGLEYSNFATINDQLYFTANDGVNGIELWTSDGTETGTFLIKNINSSGDSSIGKLKVLNGMIYFSANDNINGQELWISDGTTNGTTLLKDINSGTNSSYPTDFFVFNNNMYFICNNGINGTELWKSDGTNSGTEILKDINPSTNPSINPGNNFIVFNNNFYFFANNGSTGFELWKSDGTTDGTQLLKDINLGPNNSSYTLIASATSTYFVFGATTASNGNQLWKSDGTPMGTVFLKDVPTTYSSRNYNSEFITFKNKVYFIADNNIYGNELWGTDGTSEGTKIIKDINVGIASSNISKLTPTANFIIFSATDGVTGFNTLWKSEGTLEGTSQIKEVNLAQSSDTELSFIESNNSIYFQGVLNNLNGIELLKTDGSLNNTILVSDIFHKNGSRVGNRDYTPFNNKLIFAGSDGLHGIEPFITDGTISGTKMIKDINPNYNSLYNDYDYRPSFTKAGNNVFFRANDGTSGFELFKTDGTESGTSLLKDIAPGGTSSIGQYTLFMSLNDIVFFRANDQIHGEELWRSDGTAEGTFLLKDIFIGGGHGVSSSNLFYDHAIAMNENCYAILNGYLYFIGKDNQDSAIWRTDGTTNGTIKVVSIPSSGTYDYRPEIINSANGKIFFKTDINNSSYGNNSLWSTDGTEAGTTLLGSWLITGLGQFNKNIVFNNNLYFTVFSDNGLTLMKSDGTPNGTIALTTENFTNYNIFKFLKSCGNFVYFSTGQSGYSAGLELWKTNGTLAGTTLVEAPPPGTSSYFANCTCIQNNLFFIRKFYSDKIWYVDNVLQTSKYFQINILNSNNFSNFYGVSDIMNLNDNLLFDGVSQESGNELYYSNTQNLLQTEEFNSKNIQTDKVKIFPNPSNGKINLSISDNSQLINIKIYNVLGANILNVIPESADFVDLSKLNSGIYFIKITTENFIETKKIIIK
jgi:ELWxxDGT repeat protein